MGPPHRPSSDSHPDKRGTNRNMRQTTGGVKHSVTATRGVSFFHHILVTPGVSLGGFRRDGRDQISHAENELHLNSLGRQPPQARGGEGR